MRKLPSTIVLNDLIIKFSSAIANESISLMRTYGKFYGSKFTNDLVSQFITLFVDNLITEALNRQKAHEDGDPVEAYHNVSRDFSDMKFRIQDAVANGFTLAFSKFSNKYVDYFCVIKPVGPAINKKAC